MLPCPSHKNANTPVANRLQNSSFFRWTLGPQIGYITTRYRFQKAAAIKVARRRPLPLVFINRKEENPNVGSIKKKRRAKMSKHKHSKRLKLNRHKNK